MFIKNTLFKIIKKLYFFGTQCLHCNDTFNILFFMELSGDKVLLAGKFCVYLWASSNLQFDVSQVCTKKC